MKEEEEEGEDELLFKSGERDGRTSSNLSENCVNTAIDFLYLDEGNPCFTFFSFPASE